MAHIVNKPHGLYYNGELIGIITNIDPFGGYSDLRQSLSPDEGLADTRPIEQMNELDQSILRAILASCLPETIPLNGDDDEIDNT